MMDFFHKIPFATIASYLEHIWHYTLIVIDNKPIKFSNIFLAIVIFILGLRLSTRVTVLIRHHIIKKLKADKDSANVIEKLAVYLVYITYIIIGLQIANVPLSAFAFVSGALLLGVSLGAQNIINNLISGFIIMIEKPVKIGDVIEIEHPNNIHTTGIVKSINARCIIITNFANIDILVPNSKLLENNVINWTYSDSIIRCQLELKVLHQSDHRMVMDTILKVLEANTMILKNPLYSVHFLEIAELGAKYEINYYYDLKNGLMLKKVKSDINLELVKTFQEKNIEFAVYFNHFDALKGDL